MGAWRYPQPPGGRGTDPAHPRMAQIAAGARRKAAAIRLPTDIPPGGARAVAGPAGFLTDEECAALALADWSGIP